MPEFEYSALDAQRRVHKGKVTAADELSARRTISEKGYTLSSIKKEGGFDINNLQIPGLTGRVKTKDISIMTRQLATMINAGIPLAKSLNTVNKQVESDGLKKLLVSIVADVEGGTAFAEALAPHKKHFSDIFISMVRAGEASGTLDETLLRLASQLEKDQAIKKKVKSAMTYPIVLIVIMMGAFFVLMVFVVPKIGSIIKDLGGPDAELPLNTRVLIALSDFMVARWYIMIAGMTAFIWGFRRWKSTKKGRFMWHTALLKTPQVKNIITKVAIARFARIFSSMMHSGVNVIDALTITSDAMGNDVIAGDLKHAIEEVKNGKQLSVPLEQSKHFPVIVSQMLAIGEETGETDTILLKVADFYEEEVDNLIASISSIIEPVMIVLLGSMVGLIAVSVIGPISSLSSNIGG